MKLSARHGSLLALLLIAHLALASAYSVWNPLAEAPDEADHFAYIRYLAAERSLPSGPTVTQSKHPPLYHIVGAIIASVGDPLDYQFLRANPDVSLQPAENRSANFFIHTTLEDWPWRRGPLAFHAVRLWSVLLSTLTVLATYGMARRGFPNCPGLALVAAGVLAFIPEFAFIGGSVNNDNGAALLGTLILWGALILYRSGGRWQAAWWTPLAMGLGLLTKISTVALWPVVLLAIVMGASKSAHSSDVAATNLGLWLGGARQTWPRWLGACAFVLVVTLGVASPWLLRNWNLYGDPLGQSLTQQTIDLRTARWGWSDTVWLIEGWFRSFWGKFGGAGHIPMPSWTYWTLGVISLLSLAGLPRVWRRGPDQYRPVTALLVVAVLCVVMAIWWYSLTALGTDQGRLLYPAISALVTLFVLGLSAWIPARRQTAVAVIGLAALAALCVYALVSVIRPAFAPPSVAAREDVPTDSLESPILFGPLELIAADVDPEPVLYWYAPEQPADDWRTNLRVVAEDGSLVWEWRRSPGYGRWSTDRWPAGTTLRDEYTVVWPEWAGPGRYSLEVGAYAYGEPPALPWIGNEPAASEDHPYVVVGWIERD